MFRSPGLRAAVLIALLAVPLGHALADDAARISGVPLLPKYQQECAACHVAYPPGMLPKTSWQHLMDNLPRHYGTDASLDPATGSCASRAAGRMRWSSMSAPTRTP